MEAVPGIILLVLVFSPFFYFLGYHWIDHQKCEYPHKLKRDARIINIDVDRASIKGRLKTTVTFSDGFEYWSYKTESEQVFLNNFKISVSKELAEIIIEKAIIAHSKLCDKNNI